MARQYCGPNAAPTSVSIRGFGFSRCYSFRVKMRRCTWILSCAKTWFRRRDGNMDARGVHIRCSGSFYLSTSALPGPGCITGACFLSLFPSLIIIMDEETLPL